MQPIFSNLEVSSSAARVPWSGSPKQTRKAVSPVAITDAAEADGVMKNT